MVDRARPTAEDLGREVLGPVFAEFCLRLHLVTSAMESQRPGDGVLLFCARGGLRMQSGWERFLASTRLTSAMPVAPLMVSRLVAIRPALARTVREDSRALLPSVERTIAYEFAKYDLATTATALSGVAPTGDQSRATTPEGLAALLRSPDGAGVAAAIVEQGARFTQHFDDARGGRSMPVLVDTGLYGTTRAVLADAYPDLDVRSLLLARSLRHDLTAQQRGTLGLSVEAEGYSNLRRRTALLRYWHFMEWLFEPELASVKWFGSAEEGGLSNLQIVGWEDVVDGGPGTAFAGVLAHLDGLRPESVSEIPGAASRAWRLLRRAIVWPTPEIGRALDVGTRSHDFGRDETWRARSWHGPVDALRGSMMWREGEIARSGGAWRIPLQGLVELAYATRAAGRAITFRRRYRD